MEVQDFATRHIYSQLGLAETQASILDRRGATAKAMTDYLKLANVTLHRTAAEVKSDDERDRYRIGIMQTFAGMTDFGDFASAQEQMRGFFEMAIRHLDNPPVKAVNLRTYNAAPADSFEELRDQLAERLTANTGGLKDAVGIALSDLGFDFEFENEDQSARVQFGAMTGEELRETLDDESDTTYPPACLFLGLDSHTQSAQSDDSNPIDWWATSMDRHRVMSEHIGRWLKETLA